MLKRIYRFEVDREAARDNLSVVYDARDQLDDSPVTLYEWAPDAVDPTATDRFSQAIPSLQDVEAFNSETHFYIAAKSPNPALLALRILRGQQLFTGSWPGIAAPPPPPAPAPAPPPPAPTPAPSPTPPPPVQRGTGSAKMLWASLSIILAIGGVLGYMSYQRSQQEEAPKKAVIPIPAKPLVSVPKKGMFDRSESLPIPSPVVPAPIPEPAPVVPPAEKILAVCLQNPTNVDIVYQLSWSGQRETKTLKKGDSQVYDAQSRVLLEFRIDFDNNFAPGYTGTRLVLPANEVDAPADCAKARQYSFSTKGQQIGLTARTWTPGFNHPFAANVVQSSTKEGSWVPATGFRWYNPQDPADLNVVPTDSGLIGVAVSTDGKSKYCTISSVRPDGPAAKVNLHAGLEIHRVGGMVASGWTVDQCKTAIRGPINSSVSIEVYDPTLNMSYTVNVLRQ